MGHCPVLIELTVSWGKTIHITYHRAMVELQPWSPGNKESGQLVRLGGSERSLVGADA